MKERFHFLFFYLLFNGNFDYFGSVFKPWTKLTVYFLNSLILLFNLLFYISKYWNPITAYPDNLKVSFIVNKFDCSWSCLLYLLICKDLSAYSVELSAIVWLASSPVGSAGAFEIIWPARSAAIKLKVYSTSIIITAPPKAQVIHFQYRSGIISRLSLNYFYPSSASRSAFSSLSNSKSSNSRTRMSATIAYYTINQSF